MEVLKAIEDLHDKWITTELYDPVSILDFCMEEIAFYPDEKTVITGKRDISAWIKETYQNSKLKNIETEKLQIHHLEPLACLIADFKTTYMTFDKKLEVIHGQHFWVLQKSEGKWLVKSVTWKVF